MNILILNWRDPKNPKSGGAELVTLEHAKQWVKHGHTVTWFTSLFPGGIPEETIGGVNIVRRGNALGVYVLAPFFYLSSKQTFDVVIDEIHGIPFFTPFYVKKSKRITFIHEIAGEIWDYMYPFPLNIVGRLLEKLYLRLYKHEQFWTDAPSTVDELVEYGIPRGNCTDIACPITNPGLLHLPQKEKEPTFIFVSRIVKMKGIERVLEAFVYIFQKQPTAKLWIVGLGDPKYIQYLRSKIDDLEKLYKLYNFTNSVLFYGKVSQEKKLELMKRAHMLLHASVKEGWGLVVIEAASQGTPAVVYNVAGLKDSVKNRQTGIVLDNNTPKDLAEQALLLLSNKKRYTYLSENCLGWAKSLTWKKATKKSLQLLSSL